MTLLSASAPSPLPAVPPSDQSGNWVDRCLDLTAEALVHTRAATTVEVSHALGLARQAAAGHTPLDLVEATARAQGHQEEHLGTAILSIAEKLSTSLNPSPPLIPFAGKLIAPSAFYESFDHLHQLARHLLAPVIFAEDTDSIGVAALNPFAANLLASAIQDSVFRRVGIRPFLTVVRLDYESWTFLCRKHFEL
jgi:hypothetical protein